MRHMFISVWIDRFKKINKIKLVKIMPDGNNWNLMEIIRWSCPLAYIAKSISNPSIPPLSGLRQQAKSREAILKSTNSTMSSPPSCALSHLSWRSQTEIVTRDNPRQSQTSAESMFDFLPKIRTQLSLWF